MKLSIPDNQDVIPLDKPMEPEEELQLERDIIIC
jgi:hypothetical protein